MSSPQSKPRPLLTLADGRYDGRAIMALAHELAREDIAHAAGRGRVRRCNIALRDALRSAWSTAQTHRYCTKRDARTAVLPVDHAALLNERTAALMIDSGRRMAAEVAAIEARAAAMGIRM